MDKQPSHAEGSGAPDPVPASAVSDIRYRLQLIQGGSSSSGGGVRDTAAAAEAAALAHEVSEILARLFTEYIRVFFTGDALQRMMAYMCNSCTMEVRDPVPATLNMFLSSNIVFMATQTGIMPFRNMPMAVYPYAHMTAPQREMLLRYLDAVEAFDACTVSAQMGGGFVVGLKRAHAPPAHYLDHSEALTLFCDKVMQNKQHGTPHIRLAICNIILQHVGSTIGVTRETMRCIYSSIQKRHLARDPDETMAIPATE